MELNTGQKIAMGIAGPIIGIGLIVGSYFIGNKVGYDNGTHQTVEDLSKLELLKDTKDLAEIYVSMKRNGLEFGSDGFDLKKSIKKCLERRNLESGMSTIEHVYY